MITYQDATWPSEIIRVSLEGKQTGTIRKVTHGFAYFPLGSKTPGEILPTIAEIKATLEEM